MRDGDPMADEPATTSLLLVEDDRKLVRALERGLALEGYAVDVAYSGEEALERVSARTYAAVVLDVMLPGADGFEVCEAMRREQRTLPSSCSRRVRRWPTGSAGSTRAPTTISSSPSTSASCSRACALSAGAASPSARRWSRLGELRLDSATRTVTRAGQEVELTAREFEVLAFLARHEGEVVSRRQMLEQIWDGDDDGSPNVVDVYVGYLRRKLEDSSGRQLIRTIRGVGFVLEA